MTVAVEVTPRPTGKRWHDKRLRWEQMSADERLQEYFETKDPALCTLLLLEHDGIARCVARRYAATSSSVDDLYQAARIGLLGALQRFDPERGRFAAFAFQTVRGEVQRHVRDTAWPLSARRSAREGYLSVRDEADILVQQLGRQPTADDIARSLRTTPEQVRRWQSVSVASMSWSLNDGQTDTPDPASREAEKGFLDVDDRLEAQALLDRLSPLEERILRMRYGREMSQRQIGEAVGISQIQVSRILRLSLARLRDMADPASTADLQACS